MKKINSKFPYILFSFLAGAAIGGKMVSDICEELLKEKEDTIYKFKGYFHMQTIWFMKRIHGKSIADWFMEHQNENIAIYGMGDLGKLLLQSLKGTSINVLALMDINKEQIEEDFGVKFLTPDDELNPEIDMVVVTVTHAFDAIKKTLSVRNADISIVSLEDIIYNL